MVRTHEDAKRLEIDIRVLCKQRDDVGEMPLVAGVKLQGDKILSKGMARATACAGPAKLTT